jgi:hypothetical protein
MSRHYLLALGWLAAMALPAFGQTATPLPTPPAFSPPQGLLPRDQANKDYLRPQPLPNEFLKNGVGGPFGTPADRMFHTPVGPPGAKANLFDQPSAGFLLRQQQIEQERPGFWQRLRTLFGLGNSDPQPGTIPQQSLPPGSVDPRIFGGR